MTAAACRPVRPDPVAALMLADDCRRQRDRRLLWRALALAAALHAVFILLPMPEMTRALPLAPESEKEGVSTSWRSSRLLVLAITIHNIPEGLAVGIAFGAVGAGYETATLGAAVALAIGIGFQNCP